MDFLWFPIEDLPFIVIAFIVAFTLHEFAHAYTAYKFGDMTAYNQGRVTLNPRVHLDVFGTILVLLAGFGWAKPVPVNASRFKYPRMMSILVTAAGPFSNLVIVIVSMILVYTLNQTGLLQAGSFGVYSALIHLFYYLIIINISLFVFNLIPLPPLDGYRIITNLLPYRIYFQLAKYEHWGMYIFLLLVLIPPLNAVTISPLMSNTNHVFIFIMETLDRIFTKDVDWHQFSVDLSK
jgi:Zn-dependent protease